MKVDKCNVFNMYLPLTNIREKMKIFRTLTTVSILILVSISIVLPIAYVFASPETPILSTDSGYVGNTSTVSGTPSYDVHGNTFTSEDVSRQNFTNKNPP